MKKVGVLVFLFFFVLGLRLANSGTESNEANPFLKEMFHYANTHNVKSLEELAEKIKQKNNRLLNNANFLALYIASPEKYKRLYVDNFPVDYEGIMLDYYEQIELKMLTPKFLYSIESIGLIAEEGDEKAIEKVLTGMTNSDGVVAESFCQIIVKLLQKQPEKTLNCLASLSKAQRKKNYACFGVADSREFALAIDSLKKIKTKIPNAEREVLLEIESYQ